MVTAHPYRSLSNKFSMSPKTPNTSHFLKMYCDCVNLTTFDFKSLLLSL